MIPLHIRIDNFRNSSESNAAETSKWLYHSHIAGIFVKLDSYLEIHLAVYYKVKYT